MINRRNFLTASAVTLATPAIAQAQYYVPTRPDVGFIFIAASWCAFCHRAAPILDRLAKNSDIPVLVISTDDKPIPPFPEFRHDPGHPMLAGNLSVPRTALYNATTDEITGVVNGFSGTGSYTRNLQKLVQMALRGEAVRG